MQRVKLAFVGLVAALGVLALTGCQANPDRAASVGNVSITHADVDAAVAAVEADAATAQQNLPPEARGDARQLIVGLTVFNELARRYAKERGISVPAADYEATASQVGLPASDPYVRLSADAQVARQALIAQAKPGTPTEADYQETYDRYTALAGAQAVSYEEVKPELAKLPEFINGLGLRNELTAAANRYGLDVNPRYAPLSVPLIALSNDQLVIVSLPLGKQGTGAVRDL